MTERHMIVIIVLVSAIFLGWVFHFWMMTVQHGNEMKRQTIVECVEHSDGSAPAILMCGSRPHTGTPQ